MKQSFRRVFVIHGYQSHPKDCWFPWLKKELVKRGCKVFVPRMPNPARPEKSSWVQEIKRAVGAPDENTFLVGHSLGAIAIIRYIETLRKNQKIGGAIFVAGRAMGRKTFGGRYGRISSFFKNPISWRKIKRRCKKFTGLYSADDPVVSTENGRLLKQKLGAKFILVNNKGHFSRSDKVYKLPAALRAVIDIYKK